MSQHNIMFDRVIPSSFYGVIENENENENKTHQFSSRNARKMERLKVEIKRTNKVPLTCENVKK